MFSHSRRVIKPFRFNQYQQESCVGAQRFNARVSSLPPSRRRSCARVGKRESSRELTLSSQRPRVVHAFAKTSISGEGVTERAFSSDLEREVRERFGPKMPFMQMGPVATGIAEDIVLEFDLWRTKGREPYLEVRCLNFDEPYNHRMQVFDFMFFHPQQISLNTHTATNRVGSPISEIIS